ncbi:MAG: SdrD B-like domain-containing protein, partial [Novipirellula sp. JB048]
TTDGTGLYRFSNLPPGRYHNVETQPEGYIQGGQQVGSGGGEVIGEDHLALDLIVGKNVVDYNFCELAPSSISGSVWQETDLDRIFNDGDLPLSNVRIDLLNESGQLIAETRTDASGRYVFHNLAPGVYAVREHQPDGLFDGGAVVGSLGGTWHGDDLIVGIELSGGSVASEYNFPEVPPASISGFVFQDGDALSMIAPPDAKDLRDYRDGILAPGDIRIQGVTLELRNVLGQPFTADRALPGTYADGAITVTTDEFGFYEFTGLRPGTYSVYQVQPENYIDGLDTPGSTGGVAVNPADTLDQRDAIRIQTLTLSEATDPRDDAILFIDLAAGGSSEGNNFSEIAIIEPAIPLVIDKPVEEILVHAPIETFPESIRLVSFGAIDAIRRPSIADDEWAVSWHLSVINGGFPGGVNPGNPETIKPIAATSMPEDWPEGEHNSGRWGINNSEGALIEIANRLTMCDKDAIALTGDFDGDGKAEAVLFINGHWFVDLNGNGRWDKGDMWMKLGTALDRPVVGDWDGDGKDDIGIFGRQWHRDPQRINRDPGLPNLDNKRRRELSAAELATHPDHRGEDRKRLLRRGDQGELRADAVDHVFQYGEQVDIPVSGDWNGDGIDQIGVFRDGTWILDTDGDGRWTQRDETFQFGRPGDEPIVGDFNGDGIDEVGVVRGDLWIIDIDGDRKLTENDLHIRVPRPSADSQPIVGDWDGDGRDEPGYYDAAG